MIKIQTFVKEHKVASGVIVAMTAIIVTQKGQIKALTKMVDFLVHESR